MRSAKRPINILLSCEDYVKLFKRQSFKKFLIKYPQVAAPYEQLELPGDLVWVIPKYLSTADTFSPINVIILNKLLFRNGILNI